MNVQRVSLYYFIFILCFRKIKIKNIELLSQHSFEFDLYNIISGFKIKLIGLAKTQFNVFFVDRRDDKAIINSHINWRYQGSNPGHDIWPNAIYCCKFKRK